MALKPNNGGSDDVQTVTQLLAPRPNTTGPQKSEYSASHEASVESSPCAQARRIWAVIAVRGELPQCSSPVTDMLPSVIELPCIYGATVGYGK